MKQIKVGGRVISKREIDRFPFFVLGKNKTGTIVESTIGENNRGLMDRQLIAIKMDNPIEGCEEWDNQIEYYDESIDEFVDDFQEWFE